MKPYIENINATTLKKTFFLVACLNFSHFVTAGIEMPASEMDKLTPQKRAEEVANTPLQSILDIYSACLWDTAKQKESSNNNHILEISDLKRNCHESRKRMEMKTSKQAVERFEALYVNLYHQEKSGTLKGFKKPKDKILDIHKDK